MEFYTPNGGCIKYKHFVDVGEKPKPHWIRMCDKPVHHEIICKCSECGYGEWKPPEWWKIIANYCPNCGADMREES